MKVEKHTASKLYITDVPNLDPINVYLEDISDSKGEITISCFGEAWSCYWGAMGGRDIATFFRQAGVDYLANKLSPQTESTVQDTEAVEAHAKETVRKLRRTGEIDKAEARDLYDELGGLSEPLDAHLMHRVYGDEWWYSLPNKPNHKYEYLCRIINAVKEALTEQD